MRIMIKKSLYEYIINKALYIHRYGIPGHYRYEYPDTGRRGGGITKINSGIDQTKLDALECNGAIELRHIPLLDVDEKNYYSIGVKYIKELNNNFKHIKCKGTNLEVAGFSSNHLYKDSRTVEEKILRTKLLPYIVPTIIKGKIGSDSRQMKYGNSICMLSKTDYEEDGIKKKIGIKIVLAPNKNNQLEVDFISLITIESSLIKALKKS